MRSPDAWLSGHISIQQKEYLRANQQIALCMTPHIR